MEGSGVFVVCAVGAGVYLCDFCLLLLFADLIVVNVYYC